MITNDYKNKLLKYITGNIDFASVENKPYFEETKKIKNDLYTQIKNAINENFIIKNIIEGKSQGNGTGIIALYGKRYTNIENEKGLIVLVDSNFKLLQVIGKYNDGEDIGIISDIYQDTENNIYIIEKKDRTRIVYTNNFFIKPYKSNKYIIENNKVLYLPSEMQGGKDYRIKKDYKSANYLIVGSISKDKNEVVVAESYPIAAQLTINVGEENEWKIFNFDYTEAIPVFYYTDFYVEFNDNGNAIFNIVGYVNNGFDKSLTIFKNNDINFDDMQMTYKIIETYFTDFDYYNESALIINFNLVYSAISILNRIEIYKYDGNTNNLIFSYFLENREAKPFVELLKYENEIFIRIASKYVQGNNEFREFEIGRLYKNTAIVKKIREIPLEPFPIFFVSKQFNLYNYILQQKDNMYLIQQVYNENNFNAMGANNETSLQSKSAKLFDKDNKLIYARNIYNRLVQKNTTVSTAQIPNIMLNDIDISKENLLSNTNNNINEETTILQKNQFEEVLINFINNIIVEDRNTTEYKYNKNASYRINNSISKELDYKNSRIGKYRINYKNNNSVINQISMQDIEYIGNTAKFTMSFETKEDNPATTIEVLSNDTETIYLTIDVSNLAKNKQYKISQEMEVL